MRIRRTTAAVLLLLVWMPGYALAASPAELEQQFLVKIDELLPGMGAKRIEDRQEPQLAFERICMENSAPDKQVERAALCRAMMQRVGPDVAMPARVWLLRKVEPIGRDEVVERLTELLGDSEPRIRELARRALANNPAPEAAASLRSELGKAEDELWQAALINALAARRDLQAVPQLAKLSEGKSDLVAAAAITALGQMGNDYAVQALMYLRKTARPQLRATVVDASFHVAEALMDRGDNAQAAAIYTEMMDAGRPENIRITALQGLTAAKGADAIPQLLELINGPDERLQLVAARCAQRVPGARVTRQLTKSLETASPGARAVLLEMLGQRGDKRAMKAVAKYLEANDPDVRIAAVGAMRFIGDGSMVQPLARFAAENDGPQRDAARDSLKWMKGQDVDQKILDSIGKQPDRVNAELVRAAAVRLMKPALPALLANVGDPDESVRVPVIYNIGKLATPQDLSQVLLAFGKLQPGRNEDTARDALVQICSRIGDGDARTRALIEILPAAEPGVQAVVVQALGRLRGQGALEAIREARKSPAPRVQQAAKKALADWGPVYCTEWVFAGPYKKDGADGAALFDEVFPPEGGDDGVEWKPVKGQRGKSVDLEKLAKVENACGYLRTEIVSDKQQDVVLMFGSDDGLKVWLNGSVVHANNAVRGLTLNEDKAPAKLKKGANTLLVKVTQGGGSWAMSCGIRAVEGGPPDAIQLEAK